MIQKINPRKIIVLTILLFVMIQLHIFGQSFFVKSQIQSKPLISIFTLSTKIDSYIEPYVQMKDFSGVIFIVKNNQIIFNKNYGKANFEMNSPINSDTRFRIGSISKQFTAAAILFLQQQGKLSVNDTLNKFIPDFPKGDKITLSLLLSHKAGISRDLSNEDIELQLPHTPEELIEIIKKKPLIAEPGTKASYSNNGYRILAYVVEKTSGESLNNFLTEKFFTSLGIKNIGQDSQIELLSNRANGYVRWLNDSLGNAPFHDVSNDIGSGGLYASASDLYKWNKGLFDAKTLQKSTVEQMISADYGIGEGKRVNHRTIGHDGRLTGFTSFNDYYPDDNTYIIFLSNIESGAVASIRKDLPAILFGEPYKLPLKRSVEMKLDSKIIDSYAGRYEVFPGLVLTAKKVSGNLILGSGDGGFFPLIPESETKFFYPLRYAEIEFVKYADGSVKQMKWREFGSEFVCKKIS